MLATGLNMQSPNIDNARLGEKRLHSFAAAGVHWVDLHGSSSSRSSPCLGLTFPDNIRRDRKRKRPLRCAMAFCVRFRLKVMLA